jgi:hypothetical protein
MQLVTRYTTNTFGSDEPVHSFSIGIKVGRCTLNQVDP